MKDMCYGVNVRKKGSPMKSFSTDYRIVMHFAFDIHSFDFMISVAFDALHGRTCYLKIMRGYFLSKNTHLSDQPEPRSIE